MQIIINIDESGESTIETYSETATGAPEGGRAQTDGAVVDAGTPPADLAGSNAEPTAAASGEFDRGKYLDVGSPAGLPDEDGSSSPFRVTTETHDIYPDGVETDG